MHWVYIEFTALTLDQACQDEGRTSAPVVVYDPACNQIVQCNDAALTAGIAPGIGMAQAAALHADISIVTLDKSRQHQYLETLASQIYQVASDIVLYTPDALAIRLDNLAQYYGSVASAWNTIARLLGGRKLHFRFADGWSPLTAKLLAKAQSNQLFGTKDAMRRAITQCSLSHTDLSEKAIALFHRIGVRSISQLLGLPVSELGKRFKNDTIIYLNELRGETFPKVRYFQPKEYCQLNAEPAFEIAEAPRCRPWVVTLLKDLEVFLRIRNLVTSSLTFTVHYREAEPDTHLVASSAPLARYQDWLTLTDVWLESLTLTSPLVSLSLQCTDLEPVDDSMGDFFTDRYQYFANQQLLSRLRTRLGEQAVWQPAAGDDHRMHRQTVKQDAGADPIASDFCPAIGLVTPQSVEATGTVTFGPVRVQTGWWDKAPVKRDYFVLQTPNGCYQQVFRDHRQRWHVHGYFS